MIVNRLLRSKQAMLVAGCACVGGYVAYKYWKKRTLRTIDEGFEDVAKIDELNDKRVLLLGMNGSGKTTLMKHIRAASKDKYNMIPQSSYDFVIYKFQKEDYNFEIWEIDEKDDCTSHWSNFLNDIDLVVYMVDSSVDHRLPVDSSLLKELLGDVRLNPVPVLIIANKQDLPQALSPDKVKEALDLKSIVNYKNKIHIIGCEMSPTPEDHNGECEWYHSSTVDVFNKIFTLATHP